MGAAQSPESLLLVPIRSKAKRDVLKELGIGASRPKRELHGEIWAFEQFLVVVDEPVNKRFEERV